MNKSWAIAWTAQARKDHTDIIRWTRTHFGSQQAAIYVETIALAAEALREGPATLGAKQREDLGSGIYTLHVARDGRKGRHFLVFHISGDHSLEVLRILHDTMDLPAHINP